MMQDVTRAFPRRPVSASSPRSWTPTPRTRSGPFPRPAAARAPSATGMNSWAQGEGQPGLGYIFWREGSRAARARSPRTWAPSATDAIREAAGPGRGDAAFFVAGDPERSTSSPDSARTKVGQDLGLVETDVLQVLLDRRLPHVRVERGEKQGRLLAQPLLHAAGRAGGAGDSDPLDILAYQYDIVCNGMSCARARSVTTCPRSCSRPSRSPAIAPRVESQFGGMLAPSATAPRPTAASPRASTASSCCWPARRHPRGDRLPAEPAGPGPDDERALGGSERQLKELSLRVQTPLKTSS